MKKLVLSAALAIAAFVGTMSISPVRAQAPLAPQTVPQTLVTTPEMRAMQFDNQVVTQVNNLFYQIAKARQEGLPARGNLPAVSPAQVDAGFGADNLAKLQAAAAALAPTSTPAPSAAPTPTPVVPLATPARTP